MSDKPLTVRALNRATLGRQMLLRREKLKPAAAIERLGALQAQVPRPPFVALWSRVAGFRREDLIRAIERREVVRGTMMRGTLHLLARNDFIAFRPVLKATLSWTGAAVLRDRAKGLDVARLAAAAREYFDRAPRTFAELRGHLAALFPTLDERAMAFLVRMHLPLIQTPAAGAAWGYPAVADFAVADSWLGEPLAEEDGTHALALRYFAAFGPASAKDLQTWSGLPFAAKVVEELRPTLRTFRDARGRELFDVPKAKHPSEDVDAPVRFLPEFDNVLLAYAERSRIIADEHRPAIYTKNLLVPATFLVDGFVAGRWAVERKKGAARLVATPFGALGKVARAALEEEGEKLLEFLEPDAARRTVDLAKGKGKA